MPWGQDFFVSVGRRGPLVYHRSARSKEQFQRNGHLLFGLRFFSNVITLFKVQNPSTHIPFILFISHTRSTNFHIRYTFQENIVQRRRTNDTLYKQDDEGGETRNTDPHSLDLPFPLPLLGVTSSSPSSSSTAVNCVLIIRSSMSGVVQYGFTAYNGADRQSECFK